jgi:hypothetical protein
MANSEVFLCHCGSWEHQLVVAREEELVGYDVVASISCSLCDNLSLQKRLKLAIKYIFGYRSKYGMFSEILLTKAETHRLIDTLSKFVDLETTNVPS